MIFQKSSPKQSSDNKPSVEELAPARPADDTVETVVGPSVNVEGDFASEGNIIVKGTVSGSVHTSKHLLVEAGARIMANVRAGSVQVAGEVKGNMKVKESLELMSTAKVVGDIEVKTLSVEPGALVYGKVMMPGVDLGEGKITGRGGKIVVAKKFDDTSVII